MKELIAARSMTYGTRRLSAGDLFTASKRDARLLLGLQRAREVAAPADAAPPTPSSPASKTQKPKAAGKRPVKRQATGS